MISLHNKKAKMMFERINVQKIKFILHASQQVWELTLKRWNLVRLLPAKMQTLLPCLSPQFERQVELLLLLLLEKEEEGRRGEEEKEEAKKKKRRKGKRMKKNKGRREQKGNLRKKRQEMKWKGKKKKKIMSEETVKT